MCKADEEPAYRVHKRKYSYRRDGKQHASISKTWTIDFYDHLGRYRRLSGLRNKDDTVELAKNVIRLVRCAERRERPDAHLVAVMKGWPPRVRRRMVEWEVVDAQRDAETRPLVEHVEDWRQHLEAKGNTQRHVTQVAGRVLKLLRGAGFVRWSDLETGPVERWLKRMREDRKQPKTGEVKRGISAPTHNFYVTAIKQFCRWMASEGRAAEKREALRAKRGYLGRQPWTKPLQ